MVSFGPLVLWCHVTSAVNRAKSQSTSIVRLNKACDLVVKLVWAPLLGNVPLKTVDPVFGAEGWHCAVDVARVVQHLVAAGECLIDPL